MTNTQISSVFKILADDKRRKMITLLGKQDHTVGELEKSLKLSQSATSQHLKLLHSAGLVSSKKHGNFRIYSLKTAQLKRAMDHFNSLWDTGLGKMKKELEGK